jgi:SAM-dependent methyltransferase
MTDAPNADQDDYWNGRAGQTWAQLQTLMDRQLEPLGLEAQRVLNPKPGERLIDIGCGSGQTTLALAQAVGPQGSVLGLDLSRPMLDVAEKRAEAAGLPATFAARDVQTAQWDQAYDGAYSRFGVMFFADPGAAFANIRKALKPGGRLAFVCWRPYDQNPWMAEPLKAAEAFLPPSPPSDPTAPGPFAFADPERVRGILAGAGFVDVEIAPFDTGVGSGDLEDAMLVAQRIGPLGAAIRENPEAAPKVLEAVRPVLETYVQPDGRVLMPAAVWIVSAKSPR